MIQAVLCTHSSQDEVEAALSSLATAESNSFTIVSRPEELDGMTCPPAKLHSSLKRGVTGGAAVGALIGFGLLLYLPSLHTTWGELSLVAWTSFGWALFGMIVGSSGLFAGPRFSQSLVNHFEEAMRDGKILLSIQVATRNDLKKAAETLLPSCPGDMHEVIGSTV
jgi:hypothetical protein